MRKKKRIARKRPTWEKRGRPEGFISFLESVRVVVVGAHEMDRIPFCKIAEQSKLSPMTISNMVNRVCLPNSETLWKVLEGLGRLDVISQDVVRKGRPHLRVVA